MNKDFDYIINQINSLNDINNYSKILIPKPYIILHKIESLIRRFHLANNQSFEDKVDNIILSYDKDKQDYEAIIISKDEAINIENYFMIYMQDEYEKCKYEYEYFLLLDYSIEKDFNISILDDYYLSKCFLEEKNSTLLDKQILYKILEKKLELHNEIKLFLCEYTLDEYDNLGLEDGNGYYHIKVELDNNDYFYCDDLELSLPIETVFIIKNTNDIIKIFPELSILHSYEENKILKAEINNKNNKNFRKM